MYLYSQMYADILLKNQMLLCVKGSKSISYFEN